MIAMSTMPPMTTGTTGNEDPCVATGALRPGAIAFGLLVAGTDEGGAALGGEPADAWRSSTIGREGVCTGITSRVTEPTRSGPCDPDW